MIVHRRRARTQLLKIVIPLAVLVVICGGIAIWQLTSNRTNQADISDQQNTGTVGPSAAKVSKEEIGKWTTATSQTNTISMLVPDGWRLSTYPDGRIGGSELTYHPGDK